MPNVKRWEENEHWVEINLDLCKASGECVNVCPVEVYDIINGKVNADNIFGCIECGACQDTCPYDAIVKHWAWR